MANTSRAPGAATKKARLSPPEFFRTRSIRYLLRVVFITIICCFLGISAVYLLYTGQITKTYGQQITNIEFANNLSRIAKEQVAKESWYIVAGRQTFGQSNIYDTLSSIQSDLGRLYDNTSPESGRELVDAATRASETLKGYVDRLREQTEQDQPVSYRQMTLSEINKVSQSIYDVLQEFAYTQITGIARANVEIQQTAVTIMIVLALLTLAILAIALAAYHMLKEAVDRPNMEIAAMADRILQGDLATEVPPPGLEELNKLADSINLMAGRIRTLVDRNIEEQKNLQKAEMRALQAQITPHFLYNTFDTIVWLADAGETEKVVDVTLAFSNYYRIALSRGRDFITVEEEIGHVQAYLTIQQIRYESILRYEIDVVRAMLQRPMLKLLLQPIVENALYHGVKNRRQGGFIRLTGRLLSCGSMRFIVEDDGIGMEPAQLRRLQETVTGEDLPETSGYGLYNVNRRLRLYYGSAGLEIESEFGKGTKVAFTLPHREAEK